MSVPLVTVGIVGYSVVVDSYPLGPQLMAELQEAFEGRGSIAVENFSWSPIHIVQKYQGGEIDCPDRMVLVGCAAESRFPGRIAAYRWRGGRQPEMLVQERVHEAVTGIVDLENTLMIGDYFEIWPRECLTVEVDLAPDTFGRMVVAESDGRSSDAEYKAELGYSPEDVRRCLVQTVRSLALEGAGTRKLSLTEKTADMLSPVRSFAECHVAAPV